MSKAVILLSGGLDSTTTLAIAKSQGFDCYALSFDYGQKQKSELNSAKQISELFSTIEHRIMTISLNDIGGSALTDSAIDVPKFKKSNGIPITYVPARNTIFLSYAMAWAEVLECQDVFIGVNALDYSGYPDCRAEYISAFETMANLMLQCTLCRIQSINNMSSLVHLEHVQTSINVYMLQCTLCRIQSINNMSSLVHLEHVQTSMNV
jgi:7-cyano-7-deazaguanine synthase